MIKIKQLINEAKTETYFTSATDALNYAKQSVEKMGYTVDEDSWWNQVATGGSYGRFRPGVGKTTKASVVLVKNDKPQKKHLHIQLYGMESGKYELNFYVG